MSQPELLNIVFGNPTAFMKDIDLEFAQKFLDVLKSNGITDIDTARAYAQGEKNFGLLKAQSQGFTIDTKVGSFLPGAHKAENIHASVKESLDLLGVQKVHIFYLHAPDRATPLEEVLRAVNEVYQQGKFEKFGLSNYTAAEVSQVIDITTKNGYVRPTVYQGNYSVVVRKGEEELFPLLRKEKIAFYAWSPLAGGLLTGRFATKDEATKQASHFSDPKTGPVFAGMFAKDSIFAAVQELQSFIKKYNFTLTETALRWLAYHSQLSKAYGDAIILGGSKPEQYDSNIKELRRGPLPADVVSLIDNLWLKVKDESPAYHF